MLLYYKLKYDERFICETPSSADIAVVETNPTLPVGDLESSEEPEAEPEVEEQLTTKSNDR